MKNDVHGKAIFDFYKNKEASPLILHNSYGEPEEMSVEVFFRDQLDFTTLEHLALIECEGKILDLGAGAGAHALVLQDWDKNVTALDNSAGCAEVMSKSGINQVCCEDYETHEGNYDTVLALMNGIGMAGTLEGVPAFLGHMKRLLRKNGQLLIDSSDISYLYEDYEIDKPAHYYGEVKYCYEYKQQTGDWFDWVYVDIATLTGIVRQLDLEIEILHEDENDQYLARISGF